MKRTATHHPINYLLSLVTLACLISAQGFSQDAEITNYKTGIDVTYSGAKGTAYMEEYFYHDKIVSDRKVVYIRGDTLINMTHNDRNVARMSGSYYEIIGANGRDGIPNSGDEGVIRFRVDGDLHWGPKWTSGSGGTFNRAFEGPFSFNSLSYPDGTKVVGKTGDNGVAVTNKSGYFHYGVADSVGDHWHTLQIADDDWTITSTDTEWRASDGRVISFVVNPKTPALTVRATGNGQFYTTPPKTYFIPKIHDQTTYFNAGSGTVSFEIRDINGNNIYYRINGGNFISVNSNTKTLTQADFNTGHNTLEYYYKGRESFVKRRVVVKNPGFPSAGEQHGYLAIGDEANYKEVLKRKGMSPYDWHWTRMVSGGGASDVGERTKWDNNGNRGLRFVTSAAMQNALVAKINGVNAVPVNKSKTYSQYAKEMILQNSRTIENVGFEMIHSQSTLPSREVTYRGYYDVGTTLQHAYAYDLLISIFRSDQHSGGITPVEDYYLRDSIANNVVECLMFTNALQGPSSAIDKGGMWDTARKIGALVGMFAIPHYSTPYYGTSGLDGNTTVYPWTPFKDAPLTWKQVFLDEDQPMTGYPNLAQRLGIAKYNCTSEGHFVDRSGYIGHMGSTFYHAANVLAYHYPSKRIPELEKFFLRAAEGTLLGLKDDTGARREVFLTTYNLRFPEVASIGVPFVQAFDSKHSNSDDQEINGHALMALFWYDANFLANFSAPPVAPANASISIAISP